MPNSSAIMAKPPSNSTVSLSVEKTTECFQKQQKKDNTAKLKARL